LLTRPLNGVHVCAYTLNDRAIMVLINTSLTSQKVEFDVNLAPWIKSLTGNYTVIHYEENGKPAWFTSVKAQLHGKSKNLEVNELTVLEFIGK
jgi:hypothetical protein